MASPSIKAELLAEIARLGTEGQLRVLEFARSLAKSRIPGTPGERVIELAVGIDPADLQKMSEAIEEGCEQVHPDEW